MDKVRSAVLNWKDKLGGAPAAVAAVKKATGYVTTRQNLENFIGGKEPKYELLHGIARAMGHVDTDGLVELRQVGTPRPPEASEVSIRLVVSRLGQVLAQDLPADVRRDAAYLLQQLAELRAVDRHRDGLIGLLEPFAVNDSPTTETRGSTTVAPNQLDQDHAVSQTGGDHAPASSQVLGSGIQPEGGTEWKQRARHHGQDIKPISATTARRNQKKPGAKGHAK